MDSSDGVDGQHKTRREWASGRDGTTGRGDATRWHEGWVPDGADGASWDEMAANRLDMCVSVNRSGGVLT